jgi:uncharacterized protein (TIGR03435 family)
MEATTIVNNSEPFKSVIDGGISVSTPRRFVPFLPFILLASLAMGADHFDVVSIREAGTQKTIRRHSAGRIAYEGIGLAELVMKAFGLPQHQVVWPEWIWGIYRDRPAKVSIDPRWFTITATMPPKTTPEEFRLMLRNMLIERFGLIFHQETRQLAQYELSFLAGPPKMSQADPLADVPSSDVPDDNENSDRLTHFSTIHLSFGANGMSMRGDYTLAEMADFLSQYLRHPMVDRTKSVEFYKVNLTWEWNPYAQPPLFGPGSGTNRANDGEARALFSEMEKKLGLRVNLRNVSAEFLVIESLSHEATPN